MFQRKSKNAFRKMAMTSKNNKRPYVIRVHVSPATVAAALFGMPNASANFSFTIYGVST